MNGIIHHCSHPNDTDAHFRVSEDKIFLDIFNYIDHLFTKIKPKKLFFLAIDGVAPRAKMNQQRARRFRTAKEAAEAVKKAEAKGESLPKEAPFDSNCITPGTEFMEKLSRQLKYFINKKVTEDSNWRNIEIVLSGHEVPGEGEHKIMEYIRITKAQDNYNPNVRHCLYGLDADLIMLGLLSHDPHFALLREEVTYGPSSRKKKTGRVESQNFYLMHLSLMREYLDLEFSVLRDKLPFNYDLERIIDDFVLLALFVGNDFLPHLPNLHIAEGALGLMFHVYKTVLPDAGGYINDGGKLELSRLEMIFKVLSNFERNVYESNMEDAKWFKGKRKYPDMLEKDKRKKLILTTKQREIYNQIKKLVVTRASDSIHFPVDYPARDRKFIQDLAKDLGIKCLVEYDEDTEDKHLYVEGDGSEDEMRYKVFKKYEEAKVVDEEEDVESFEERERQNDEEKFIKWKRDYYKEKPKIDYDEPVQIDRIVGSYIEGLQWVLHYYYRGVASWGWFYPYHYSPKISDLHDLERFNIDFELERPFKPFEQLMGVLPEGSKNLIPIPYQDLLTNPNSPIIDFYPQEFELDMNGKKQDWEAVVNIPFIDQKKLVAALNAKEDELSEEEKRRNSFGDCLLFTYDPSLDENYPSSLPDLEHCHCRTEPYHLPTLDGLKLIKGLCDGARLGVEAMAGFPSLETLNYTAKLEHHGHFISETNNHVIRTLYRNETMVITLIDQFADMSTEDLAHEKLGKRIFVGWPFLQEGLLQAVSDETWRYELYTPSNGQPQVNKYQNKQDDWRRKADKCGQVYNKRFGSVTGTVNVIAHVLMLKGMKRLQSGALVKEYASVGEEIDYAMQTTVDAVECEDPRYKEKPAISLAEEFPIETQLFYLGSPYYGCPGIIIQHADKYLSVKMLVDKNYPKEPDFGSEIAKKFASRTKYLPSYTVAKKLGMSGLTLSKLTASLHVSCKSTDQRINLGLNLKFEAKKQKVLGYTRKNKDSWEYSERAMRILAEYKDKFPEFIQALENKHKDEIYTAEDFYPKEEAVSKIHAIKDWLRTVEVRDFEKVSLDAEQLDKEAIKDIEKAADEYLEQRKLTKSEQLLKPSHAPTILQNQTFNLGDRVVFVKDTGSVPIASKGTIVGIEKANIDVVFDTTFMSGSTLSDRCSNYRGMTVPSNSLLNLTRPQFLDRHSYNGGSRHNTGSYHQSVQNGHHMYHNSYPHYNSYNRGSGRGVMHSSNNHPTNGSYQRQVIPSNRPRGAGGSNGYISASQSHQNRSRSAGSQSSTKYIGGAVIYRGFNGNSRGSNGNGSLFRGRGGHFGNGLPSRGRGRGDGKT
ncbi:10835_t:CDS:10 [Funneliformis geosporum]|uniref:5'-3' exoribonuclease 1 n=1 Tax=Funneliformis geosporum TaxID=1117311 RepID=A0A9W4SC56_9GLOM|nr:10835_t:CDS:10 [Funneliformis geosporum]CAI2164379.1 12357_t:CDS:10 [Funneliformis geosporum]